MLALRFSPSPPSLSVTSFLRPSLLFFLRLLSSPVALVVAQLPRFVRSWLPPVTMPHHPLLAGANTLLEGGSLPVVGFYAVPTVRTVSGYQLLLLLVLVRVVVAPRLPPPPSASASASASVLLLSPCFFPSPTGRPFFSGFFPS